MLYKILGTPKLCPTCSAAYDKPLNAALLVQTRNQNAANLTGFCRLSVSIWTMPWTYSVQPTMGGTALTFTASLPIRVYLLGSFPSITCS